MMLQLLVPLALACQHVTWGIAATGVERLSLLSLIAAASVTSKGILFPLIIS